MAWKNFTEGVWIEWVDRTRRRHCQQLSEHPEGLWARVWLMFNETRASAEAERTHLRGHRTHDEFWYADRFGLNWPRLAPLPGESAAGGFQSPDEKCQSRDDSAGERSPSPPPGPDTPTVSIMMDGVDVTNKITDVMVGQCINLRLSVWGGDSRPTAFNWGIPGTVIKGCTQTAEKASVTNLTAEDCRKEQVECYWIDVNFVTVGVSVNIGGPDYLTVASFRILRPTATLTSKTTTAEPPVSVGPSPTNVQYPCTLRYGDAGSAGITWTGTVTIWGRP
jgi:hypothetical protein